MPFIRSNQAAISVTLDDVPFNDGLSWASADGAGLTANSSKTRPGAMGDEVALGGLASRDDITVQTQLSDVILGWHPTFESRVGVGRVTVGIAFLDANKVPKTGPGSTFTVAGILDAAKLPSMDVGSPDAGMYEIVVSLDQVAT